MPQLESTAKGWERERLAEYLLSRFCFIAHPSKVGDDIGSDFLCTLFHSKRIGGHQLRVPRGAFAIQIKSSSQTMDVTKHLQYFDDLDLPYFIGVVRQAESVMDVYSAEFLPVLLIHHKYKGKRLRLKLVEPFVPTPENYCDVKTGELSLLCPHVATLRVDHDEKDIRDAAKEIEAIAKRTRQRLVAKRAEEHVYDFAGKLKIFAGKGSAKHFRSNFYKRLAEVFCNLAWLQSNPRWAKNKANRKYAATDEEIRIYYMLHVQLERAGLAVSEEYFNNAIAKFQEAWGAPRIPKSATGKDEVVVED